MQEFLPLINFVKTLCDFPEKEEALIRELFQTEEVKKNETLLHFGQVSNKLYFVCEGILRTFHLNKNGTEFTRLIVSENKFCTILMSFQENIGSSAEIQALENTRLLSITKENFKKFIERSENAKNIYTKILEDFQNFQISRLEFLTSNSPLEKTEIFLKENPELALRLTDKIISTYLQITPETFSRCKKKLQS